MKSSKEHFTISANFEIGLIGIGCALVGALLYIGFQLQQLKTLNEVVAAHHTRDLADGFRRLILTDKEMVDLYHQGLKDPHSLSETEWTRFRLMIFVGVESCQACFLLKENSNASLEQWSRVEPIFYSAIATPGGRAWWKLYGGVFNREFRRRTDAALSHFPLVSPDTKQHWIDAIYKTDDD